MFDPNQRAWVHPSQMTAGRALCTGDRHEKSDAAVCDRHGMHSGNAFFVANLHYKNLSGYPLVRSGY